MLCRNLVKKPWPYNPQYIGIHIRNPNKGPRFLNQVPTLGKKAPNISNCLPYRRGRRPADMTCKKGAEHLGFLAGRDLASMFQWGISDTCSAGSGKLGCGNLALNPKPSYCHLAILPRGCIDMVCVYIHIYIYITFMELGPRRPSS